MSYELPGLFASFLELLEAARVVAQFMKDNPTEVVPEIYQQRLIAAVKTCAIIGQTGVHK